MSDEPCRFLTPGKFFRTGKRLSRPVPGTATVVRTGITVEIDDGFDGYELEGRRAKLDRPKIFRNYGNKPATLRELTVDTEEVKEGVWNVI